MISELWFQRNQSIFYDKRKHYLERFGIAEIQWCSLSSLFLHYSISDIYMNREVFTSSLYDFLSFLIHSSLEFGTFFLSIHR